MRQRCDKDATGGGPGLAVGGTYRLFEQKIAKYQNTPPDLNNFGNRSESPA